MSSGGASSGGCGGGGAASGGGGGGGARGRSFGSRAPPPGSEVDVAVSARSRRALVALSSRSRRALVALSSRLPRSSALLFFSCAQGQAIFALSNLSHDAVLEWVDYAQEEIQRLQRALDFAAKAGFKRRRVDSAS
jgi:hypothetical protein